LTLEEVLSTEERRRVAAEETLSIVRPCLAQRAEVLFAYLFGSTARGDNRLASDVDIAVFIDPDRIGADAGPYRTALLTELLSCLERNDVDLVLLNKAPAILSHRILRDGQLILSRNDALRVAFAEKTMGDYFDTAYLRRLSAEYIGKSVRNGTFGKAVPYKTPFM